jgi:hypothetical protein
MSPVWAEFFAPVESQNIALSQQRRLSRTFSLLARSRADRTNSVRIAFYGYSFIQPVWWTNLISSVQQSYPQAKIIAANLAFDRHQSPQLVRLAESSLYPFRPDLVVLMVTGDHHEIRRLAKTIRERTSADILLVNEPLRLKDRMDEPVLATDFQPEPKTYSPTPQTWFPFLNNGWLPFVSEDLDIAFVDVRGGWKSYLTANRLESAALLPDNTRLTEQGNHVMLGLLKPWFECPLSLRLEDPWDGDRISTYMIPRDLEWKKGVLRLEFLGNRVEVLLNARITNSIPVTLDGTAPTEQPGVRIHGRASSFPGTQVPMLLRVGYYATPVKEDWFIRVSDVSTNAGAVKFKFAVEGSVTGPDGEGTSDLEFLSKSKRVQIQPEDWNFEFLRRYFLVQLPNQMEVRWSTLDQGVDSLGASMELGGAGEWVVPVATGLTFGRHVFEMKANDADQSKILGIRVYRPALRVEAKRRK